MEGKKRVYPLQLRAVFPSEGWASSDCPMIEGRTDSWPTKFIFPSTLRMPRGLLSISLGQEEKI
ncbi:MAG: hypothetical protein JHC32_08275 [Candidatus Aminicenantes bacterium]|nr:hypothetical protein [Candidatus Aminicenantes bacterium]